MNFLSRSIFFTLVTVAAASVGSYAQSTRIPADLEITLQRTMCFGTCPDYKLTIKASGSVLFKGGRYTAVKGAARSRVPRSSLGDLIKEFRNANFMSFADDYSSGEICDGYMTDMPSEIISIRMNGKTKRVNHYFGCAGKAVADKLKPLIELGKSIDRISDSQRWVSGK
jgi:hypothetical protein